MICSNCGKECFYEVIDCEINGVSYAVSFCCRSRISNDIYEEPKMNKVYFENEEEARKFFNSVVCTKSFDFEMDASIRQCKAAGYIKNSVIEQAKYEYYKVVTRPTTEVKNYVSELEKEIIKLSTK